MKITIVLDTENETVEDLKRLQKGIDELIGKKLGVLSTDVKQESQQPEDKPQLNTVEPEKEPQVSSTGFPTQPETQQFSASSPHEVMEKVKEQQQGWPNEPEKKEVQSEPQQETQEKPKGDDGYEDLSGMISDIFSKSKTTR